MKRMQLILAMVFALLCVCFSGSFAFADSENASAANANEASCETDAIVGTVKTMLCHSPGEAAGLPKCKM